MINVNEYTGLTDNEMIEAAIADKQKDGIVVIPPRESAIESERDFWLLDRAILIPENTTIILQNCKIKLSDKCRDNFFRTANCGLGIAYPEKISNVHIKGEGLCILEGADHPRATGDGGKILAIRKVNIKRIIKLRRQFNSLRWNKSVDVAKNS